MEGTGELGAGGGEMEAYLALKAFYVIKKYTYVHMRETGSVCVPGRGPGLPAGWA